MSSTTFDRVPATPATTTGPGAGTFFPVLLETYLARLAGTATESPDLPPLRFPNLRPGSLASAISPDPEPKHWQDLVRGVPRLPRRSVLDFGCGAPRLRRRLESWGYAWRGIDLGNATAGQDGSILSYETAEIPLPDASVYVVLCVQRLNQTADPYQVLAEISRVLEPGGYLVGSVSQLEPGYAEASFTYAPSFFAGMLAECDLVPLEVSAGIDGLTMLARRLARQYSAMADAAALNPFFENRSPLNQIIDEAGARQGIDQRRINALKLELAGQYHFRARKGSQSATRQNAS